jgi:hypothetical protein
VGSWNELAGRVTLYRIKHKEACSLRDETQTQTKNAECFFSRKRLAEIGDHHHVAGPYLIRFAQKQRGAKITGLSRMADRLTPCGARDGEPTNRRFLRLLAAELGNGLKPRLRRGV